ncbi:MAG: hypothetical protein ACRD6W_05180 [Nitrososphaerales archaeon]
MRVTIDADILSTFARVNRLDILESLFEKIIIPASVVSELRRAEIGLAGLKHEISELTREELVSLPGIDPRLGRGESECFAIHEIEAFSWQAMTSWS